MKWRLILLIVVTLIVLHLPGIGLFLQAANTMIHESGHALAAVATQSEVFDIHLFSTTEGVTRVAFSSWEGGLITGMAGYIFASMFACMLASLWSRHKEMIVLTVLLVICAVNLLLWIRNVYGIVWAILFILLLLLLLCIRNRRWRHASTFILVLIIVIDSVRSAVTIFLTGLAQPQAAGDATLLAELTPLPAQAWGTLFLLQALFFGWIAVRCLWSVRPYSHKKTFPSSTEGI